MIPGILIGIEAQSVDFDAVAYRTAVILCEDPGSPAYEEGYDAWETIQDFEIEGDYTIIDGKKVLDPSKEGGPNVKRFGLAVSKDSPGILSPLKIDRFFNGSLFNDAYINSALLFSNQPFGPYAYNVTLKLDNGTVYKLDSNAPIPDDPYGYMRRVVKVKGENYMNIDFNDYARRKELTESTSDNSTTCALPVTFNWSKLQRNNISAIYRINPSVENVTIRITNFSSTITTPVHNVSLVGVNIYSGMELDNIPHPFSDFENERYIFTIGGVQYPLTNTTGSALVTKTNPSDFNDIELILRPAMFFSDFLNLESEEIVLVNFVFEYNFNSSPPFSSVLVGEETPNSWSYGVQYDYNTSNVTRMPFRTGELEVAIW